MDQLSSHRWTCALLGSLVLLTAVCSTGIAVVAWLQLRPGRGRTTTVDRIAYVGAAGNIYTIDRQGGNRLALTDDAQIPTGSEGRLYRFPTWSPDSRWIAFVGIQASEGRPQTNTLYSAPAAGGEFLRLFSSQESAPFYLYWSPDARRLAFLASEDGGLSLRLASLDGQTQLLDTGAPFYFTWSPDSETLITHVGGALPAGRIGRLTIGANQSEILLERPALFLAPAWSPTDDAVLFAAELDEAGPALYLADGRGEPQRPLIRYDGAVSFLWSPQGDRVAYIVTSQPLPSGLGQFAFGRIQVMDRAGGTPGTVSTEDAVALFWAPDGRKIAYLTIPTPERPQRQGGLTPASTALQTRGFRLQWRVVDLRNDEDRALATFVPAPGFLSLIPFFDQYAQSLTLWSPDSTALAYSARGADGADGIWVVDVDGRTPPQRITNGDSPVWSWK
ncbi:MAG: TolB family protein [Anaerolineae bacterium]